jgi:ATP phosphoribosyltransferase
MGVLLSSQAVLIAKPSALDDRAELVERLRLMLSGVVAARRRRYVMMNAHVDDLPAITALLPAMGAPTVMPLADDGAIAVHAAVDVNDVWELLPSLKAAGASSILVLPVERLIP